MSNVITQEQIDEGVKQAKEQWTLMLNESGMSATNFIASNSEATNFLGEYEMFRASLVSHGWKVPVLVEGINVTLSDNKIRAIPDIESL
jgi:hypothetical protein|tara:strand:- start:37420 stop:37686 length:267 start_codon:yes stop_codon:yes gene_type:complete